MDDTAQTYVTIKMILSVDIDKCRDKCLIIISFTFKDLVITNTKNILYKSDDLFSSMSSM